MAERNMDMNKCPMPVQDPDVRNKNFDEVALGYTYDMAVNEARRCLNCKNKPCVSACPVQINIPAFIERVANEDIEGAFANPLPFLLSAAVYAHRKISAKANVSAASKASRLVSDDWSVSLLTTTESTAQTHRLNRSQTVTKLLLSVPAQVVLPLPVIWLN